jgi:hypothetical protein
MKAIDFFEKSEIQLAIGRIDELLNSGIFEEKHHNIFLKSVFIELMILLRDLMSKSEIYASRICFDDDVRKKTYNSKKRKITVNDITDLIKFVRDAICHPDSKNHFFDSGNIKSTFNIVFGKGIFLQAGDDQLFSKYDDDICFFFGDQGIYFNRHIIRSFKEAKKKLIPIINGLQ